MCVHVHVQVLVCKKYYLPFIIRLEYYHVSSMSRIGFAMSTTVVFSIRLNLKEL